ncbi:MAG: hypothetical protein KY397_03260 [Gemmatimonadetes bacterium]|nr:hypothetical protein [Gemmatimonadota bacterium]
MTGMLRTLAGAAIVAVGLVLTPPVAGGTAWAQDTTAQAQEPSLRALRDRVEERYRVLPVQEGIVLIPLYDTDVEAIELSDGDIAVDGDPVTGAELRDALGEDADDLLRLSYLDADSRRVLFGIGAPPAVADTATAEADTLAVAEEEERDERRERGVAQGDRVRVGGSVRIGPDEVIDGDVVAVGGSAHVDGEVDGDVTAIGGSVHLGPEAVIDGDVTAIGGQVHKTPSTIVRGSIEETPIGVGDIRIAPHIRMMDSPFEGFGEFVGIVTWIVFLSLVACLVYLLAKRPIQRMEYRVRTSTWKAAAVGLAAQILFFPALVLTIVVLAISIIGIPLLLGIPFALLALAIGVLVGFTAVAKTLGHAAESRFGWAHEKPYIAVLVGIGLIMAVSFFGAALGVPAAGPLEAFAVILMVIGFVIQYVAWTIGLGALLLTRFGTRYTWNGEGGPAAPVPAPAGTAPPAPERPVETAPEEPRT